MCFFPLLLLFLLFFRLSFFLFPFLFPGSEFSPASEAKLEGFKRALLAKEHVWCSWIDKESGHVKSKGLIDASESLVLPLQLTGDRDIQVKPRFTMIVWPSTPTDAALCQLDDTWGPVQGACS